LDCTFLTRAAALQLALETMVEVIGIYCMVSMTEDCLWFAQQLRHNCRLLVVGGPLPTCDPKPFLDYFDVVVLGEGEQTMPELVKTFEIGSELKLVHGIVFSSEQGIAKTPAEKIITTPRRAFARDLDCIHFPARELLPNREYILYGKKKYGYAITTVMSTRGCPYHCEFCSNVVFGGSYRERSPKNVVDEIESALSLGYDRISFADDVFTMKRSRVIEVCEEITRRGLDFQWECLGRVDALDYPTAVIMKNAGCNRIFFGIESGDDRMLVLIRKQITSDQARQAVEAAHLAGLQAGAFFILFYPGDTNETVLNTLRFATSLPLDYLGLSMPYPLPGTALYDRVKQQINRPWRPEESLFGSHVLIYKSDFSEAKMWFGIFKGHIQFALKHRMGKLGAILLRIFEKPSDLIFNILK
jgi:anaerobic magnesium-protoporphyrin IX monomethyl ester cyclase